MLCTELYRNGRAPHGDLKATDEISLLVSLACLLPCPDLCTLKEDLLNLSWIFCIAHRGPFFPDITILVQCCRKPKLSCFYSANFLYISTLLLYLFIFSFIFISWRLITIL